LRTFRDAIRNKDFVLTAEVPLRAEQTVDELRGMFELLRPCADAVQLGDNQEAEGHIAALAIARIAIDAGIDAVVHVTARDRNRIAVQSDLMGAAALGVTSFVLKRGDKLPPVLKGRVKRVSDISTTEMLAMAQRISDSGKIVDTPGLFLGTYVTIITPGQTWQANRLFDKIETGARFLQTRPCLDVDLMRSYAAALVAQKVPHRASFIVTVPLVSSRQDVAALLQRYSKTAIPEKLIRRLDAASDGAAEGIAILAETLTAAAKIPGIAGANIRFTGDPAAVCEAVRLSGLEARSTG